MILHEVSCKERTTLLVFPVVSKCAFFGGAKQSFTKHALGDLALCGCSKGHSGIIWVDFTWGIWYSE